MVASRASGSLSLSVAITMSRDDPRDPMRCRTIGSVDRSAHWRSSRTSRTGSRFVKLANSSVTAPKSRYCSVAGSARVGAGRSGSCARSSGKRRVSSPDSDAVGKREARVPFHRPSNRFAATS